MRAARGMPILVVVVAPALYVAGTMLVNGGVRGFGGPFINLRGRAPDECERGFECRHRRLPDGEAAVAPRRAALREGEAGLGPVDLVVPRG